MWKHVKRVLQLTLMAGYAEWPEEPCMLACLWTLVSVWPGLSRGHQMLSQCTSNWSRKYPDSSGPVPASGTVLFVNSLEYFEDLLLLPSPFLHVVFILALRTHWVYSMLTIGMHPLLVRWTAGFRSQIYYIVDESCILGFINVRFISLKEGQVYWQYSISYAEPYR